MMTDERFSTACRDCGWILVWGLGIESIRMQDACIDICTSIDYRGASRKNVMDRDVVSL